MKASQYVRIAFVTVLVFMTSVFFYSVFISDDSDAINVLEADESYYDGQYFCLEFAEGLYGNYDITIVGEDTTPILKTIHVQYTGQKNVMFGPNKTTDVVPGTYTVVMVGLSTLVTEYISVSDVQGVDITSKGEVINELSLKIGQTEKLSATVLPSNAFSKNIMWSSKDTSVVKISSFGEVTAISPGVATISAITVTGTYAQCTITVLGAPEPVDPEDPSIPEEPSNNANIMIYVAVALSIIAILLIIVKKHM